MNKFRGTNAKRHPWFAREVEAAVLPAGCNVVMASNIEQPGRPLVDESLNDNSPLALMTMERDSWRREALANRKNVERMRNTLIKLHGWHQRYAEWHRNRDAKYADATEPIS